MVFAFGLTVLPAPAMAVSTNIVAETEGVNRLTLSQIQDLAVIYNDTVDSLELNIKKIENQERMTRNQKRSAEDSLYEMDYSTSEDEFDFEGMLEDLEAEKEEVEKDNSLTHAQKLKKLADIDKQIARVNSAKESAGKATNSANDMMREQTQAQIDQLDDALEQLADGKEDLEESLKDLEHIMRYTSAQMALSIVQLTESVELMEKQLVLIDKSIAIYELQEKLGMTTTINVDTQRTSKLEAENQLRDQKEQLDNLKRSLNQLIGRPVNNELEVVPMELSGVIDPAPNFTDELIVEFIKINPDMKALQEERDDLKASVKDSMGSDEKQDIEYQIQAKDMELKKQRQTVEDDLKAMIATMNKNAVNYRISKEKLAAEQKNFMIAEKKYQLGMISQVQLLQNELTLAQAELTNLGNGYQHYFDQQQFKLMRQGIKLNSGM